MQRILLVFPGIAILVGCSQPNEYQAPPPPSVTVAQPLVRTVTNYLEETGTTVAVERIEIPARVRGYLQEVYFKDGQDVTKGDDLYLIQPGEYKAKVAAEKATVEQVNVALTRAEIELNRQQNMLKENATSQSSVDTAQAERDGTAAQLEAAKAALELAALELAELDLEYTSITAPIDGRVERTLVRAGNLVGDGEATHL
ncbi:MAG: efflux RND transporter periplasmic adaptor subunit, partial [Planctomycetaceae bacterium]